MPTAAGIWGKTKTGGKAGFDKAWGWMDKLGAPVNKLSNKLGSEAFWPTTLDKESDKAARILRSFCKDGFYTEELQSTEDGPKQKQKVLKKIPEEVIRNAKGLAIFTTMRTGLWMSGAGGSGILVARKPDGNWSPPSGILLHTAGLGFLVGVDIYDCVVVLNTQDAVNAFCKIRCTLGGEISAVAGPVGVGGVLESEVHKRQAPLFTYLKSRGFYAGVQVDGTVIIERTDENERFYGQRIPVADILAGKVTREPREIKTLMQTIKAAQGDKDVDESLLTDAPPPADFEIEEEGHVFGVPDHEDPDPYGVHALEQEGLEIREAGTKQRPSSEAFDFNPSPSSPVFNTYRRSMDNKSISRRSSARSSFRISTLSSAAPSSPKMTDTSTQTDDLPLPSTPQSATLSNGHISPRVSPDTIPEDHSTDDVPRIKEPIPTLSGRLPTPPEEPDEEPVVVHEVQRAAAPAAISRARLVTVSKPTPPTLPPRNPIRDRKKPLIINAVAANGEDVSRDQGTSPFSAGSWNSLAERPISMISARSASEESRDKLADGFEKVDLNPPSTTTGQKENVTSDDFHSVSGSPNGRSRSPSPGPWNPWKHTLEAERAA